MYKGITDAPDRRAPVPDLLLDPHELRTRVPTSSPRDDIPKAEDCNPMRSKPSFAATIRTAVVVLALLLAPRAFAQPSFVAWESGPVRPVVLSPDGSQLFVANTPDNTLEIFDVVGGSLVPAGSVPVGMEPIAVAARNNDEVWVVNHLSDSVSIVDLSLTPPRVTRTLIVGDEPQDIVFAGTGGNRAFISTAHRGQHREDPSIAAVTGAGDPQLLTPGIGRLDVWVFDATSLGNTLGGTPVEILTFFADSPRALATDGTTVYVAAFKSGNQTTTINETLVCDGFQFSGGTGGCGPGAPGGVPGPINNRPGPGQANAPETGIIVKYDGSDWRDTLNRNWSPLVPFDLPDHDVFAFDANTLNPGQVFDHVGTILFNMVVNPNTGRLYVTNTELPNEVLFEGPGIHGNSTVQGRLSLSRISVLNTGTGAVDPQPLNQHIDYSKLFTDPDPLNHPDPGQIDHSLATPLQAVVSSGGTIYMAAFGSGKIGVFDEADIEDGSFETNFDPEVESANYIDVGGGPAGLALDETHNRLYVLTRFDNQVEVVNLGTSTVIQTLPLHDVEPASLTDGRPFLYDARLTSGNGEASCSSCHIFGDKDELAWNLGDPDGAVTTNNQPNPSPQGLLNPDPTFHPMKGPMTTQTLKGLSTHGALHWRGDRVDGFFQPPDPCTEPTGAPCSEDLSFRNFIVAFEGLVGMEGTITNGEMQQFTDFMLQVQLPPNPIRDVNNALSTSALAGEDTFFNEPGTDILETCNGCHETDPSQGFFSTGGGATFENEPQSFKVAHMRNLYTKVGMFGVAGDQIRGFGYLHDGSVPTVEDFLSAGVFQLSDQEELELFDYSMEFPTDFAPMVGQQVTMTTANKAATEPRVNDMETRAGINYNSLVAGGNVAECDLIAKGASGSDPIGYYRHANNNFTDDTNNTISFNALKNLATDANPITFTCVPPGSGERMGINRDEDNFLDGLDNCPGVPNNDQTDTDMDGTGDACEALIIDSDLDGVDDSADNCVDDPNPLQENNDGDAQGDVCDDDDDNDGLLDVVETNTGTFVDANDTGSDPFNADTDGDGIDDGTEVANGTDPNFATVAAPLGPFAPVAVAGLIALAGMVLGGRRPRRGAAA